ncbi:50S ribosomal protein L16 [Candidatus Woesearchaeota archaeon]|nr:50S ribosomal protein L16 [Candidatus Woesearchaeota archaeon]
MARLRTFVAYRKVKRPYTRKSKYRKKSFVKANPVCKIVKFDIGNTQKKFSYQLDLVSKSRLQIRDNALESARLTANRALEKQLGKANYHLKMRVYPHHILREHALASGAGADRFSTGMARSFGKPTGIAAQIKEKQPLISLFIEEEHLKIGRIALNRAKHKVPCSCGIIVKKTG